MIKTSLTKNLPKTIPSHRKRRVRKRQRRRLESGATSTKTPDTKPMNVTQNIHWWPISKKKS
jgi:hypothetical protein